MRQKNRKKQVTILRKCGSVSVGGIFLVKKHVKTKISYRRALSVDPLIERIKNGSLFGYVQWDLIVRDDFKFTFSIFL